MRRYNFDPSSATCLYPLNQRSNLTPRLTTTAWVSFEISQIKLIRSESSGNPRIPLPATRVTANNLKSQSWTWPKTVTIRSTIVPTSSLTSSSTPSWGRQSWPSASAKTRRLRRLPERPSRLAATSSPSGSGKRRTSRMRTYLSIWYRQFKRR